MKRMFILLLLPFLVAATTISDGGGSVGVSAGGGSTGVSAGGGGGGYEVEYLGANPDTTGTVLAMHGLYNTTVAASSVPGRFKTEHIQGDANGTATHFLVRVTAVSPATPNGFGFACYASTGSGSGNPPGDTPLARGYVASMDFDQTGWWAIPFDNDDTISVVSGTYYHCTFLGDPDEADGAPLFSRISTDVDSVDKWFPDCGVGGATNETCLYDTPPGVGTEPTYASENNYQTSAGWQCGLWVSD